MKRKVLIVFFILIALFLIYTNYTFSAEGDIEFDFSLDSTSYQKGDEFEVSLSGNNICSGQFTIDYDSTKLELEKPITSINSWTKSEIEGTFIVIKSGYEVITVKEDIAKLRFKINDDAELGNTSIVFKNLAVVKEDGSIEDLNDDEIVVNIEDNNSNVNVSYSTKAITNGNVVVTISSDDELQELDGWELSNDQKSLTKEYTKNTSEQVKVINQDDEESTVNIRITNIDKTAPEIELDHSTTAKTNKNVVVTIISNEELQELDGWELLEDRNYLQKEYSSNTTETIVVKDLAGNESSIEIKVENIDKTAPEIVVSYSTKNKTKEGVIVTIVSDEELQPLDEWQLSEDNKGLVKMYLENISKSYILKDIAGNETTVDIRITNIDRTEPEIQVTYSTTEPTTNNVVVTIVSNEELQELDGWTLSNNQKELTKKYNNNTDETVVVKDLVGNEKSVNISINNITDNTPGHEDVITPEVSVIYDEDKLESQNTILVYILANEDLQEVEGWTLSSDKKSLMKEYNQNVHELVVVKDLAGNSTQVEVSIVKIGTDDTADDNTVNNTTNNTIKNETNTSNYTNNTGNKISNTESTNQNIDKNDSYSPNPLPYTGNKMVRFILMTSLIAAIAVTVFKFYKKYSDKDI